MTSPRLIHRLPVEEFHTRDRPTTDMLHSRRNVLVLCIAWIVTLCCCGKDNSTSLSGAAHRVLLLTAHPDDECMFFAPTLVSLVQNSVALFSLCLSAGKKLTLLLFFHPMIIVSRQC